MAYYMRGLANETLGRKKQFVEDMKKAAKLGDQDARRILETRKIR
jgi:hypothetical protein